MEDFPDRLRRLREKEHRSRKVLSELCGLPHDAVRKYERGEVRPTMDTLIRLADYFEVSLDYMSGRSDER